MPFWKFHRNHDNMLKRIRGFFFFFRQNISLLENCSSLYCKPSIYIIIHHLFLFVNCQLRTFHYNQFPIASSLFKEIYFVLESRDHSGILREIKENNKFISFDCNIDLLI